MALAYETGPYVGLGMGIGGSILHYDGEDIDLDAWGVRGFGGYRINPNVAVEVSISQYKFDDRDGDGFHYSGDETQFALSVLPILPLTDTIDGFLKLSYSHGTSTIEAEWGDTLTDSHSEFLIGTGLTWHGDGFFIRGSLETTTAEFGDVVVTSIDVGFPL
jgi:hypothetical protein